MSNGIRYKGFKTLKSVYEADLEEVSFSKSAASKIESRELDSVAIVSFEHQFQFRMTDNGEEFASHIQTVMVLTEIDGDWRIINEHSSQLKGIPRLKQVKRKK